MRTPRGILTALALVCVPLTLAPGWVRAAEAPVAPAETPAATPSELTVKCTEFLKKVLVIQRKDLDRRMADEVAEVAKFANLNPEGVKSLEAAGEKAEDAAQGDLLAKALPMYVKSYAKMGVAGLAEIDRPEVIEGAARTDSGFDAAVHYTHALDQPAWKDGLARVLTPEQAAAWQKSKDEKYGTVSKEVEDLLDRQSDQVRTALSSPMFTRSTEINDTLNLPKERADAVTALAKKAIDASMEAWRKDARKLFQANDDSTRRRVARGMQFNTPANEEDAPENQHVWVEGIARLLTDEDRAKLASSHGLQRKRRTHALAMLMLTLMDEKVALTAAQRPRLEPILERIVQKVDELYPQPENNGEYFTFSVSIFYKAAAAAKPEEMQPILDDLQWKHWQEVSHDKAPVDEEEEEVVQPTPTPAKPTPAAVEEPEDLERLVSDYLATKAVGQRKELDAIMLLEAEDAARVAGLAPPSAARLRTAAYGSAEMALAGWSSTLEQTIRGQVQGVGRETILQRLSGTSRYYFGQPAPKDEAIWKQAMKNDLTQAQQDAWRSERDARTRYGDEAITQYLLAEFDRDFVLTNDQWERLAPVLTKALREYRPDIGQMFSSNSPHWFLTSYYMFLPLHAIPEDECKAILGKERFDRWADSNGFRYSVQYWSNVKQYHDQRTKEEKK